jgi:hypothetical protein
MAWAIGITAFLVLLAVWAAAWRDHPQLAFGIALGIMIGWVLAATFGPVKLDHIPIWLPPLPFAVVAITLITLGAIAWRLDDGEPPTSSPHDTHRH